jgi:flagellar basal-body rod modification protein FlgD
MSAVTALGASADGTAAAVSTRNDAGSEDRFLKLLVAQMQNQDPLNPLDNAQVTSQMAQINTVSGIDKLNKTMTSLSGQLLQLRSLQGASLVGREVTVAGNRLAIEQGSGVGGFDLDSAADRVVVEIVNGAGRHGFDWNAGAAADADGYRFRVAATRGSASVGTQPLMRDRVEAVSSGGDALNLELQHAGSVAYDAVKAIN